MKSREGAVEFEWEAEVEGWSSNEEQRRGDVFIGVVVFAVADWASGSAVDHTPPDHPCTRPQSSP